MRHTYLAIDLKSYYASAECASRHLDPLITNLVVADASRTEKTICLAVSPSLKAYGIPGRARLFEVVQKVKEVNAERLRNAIRNHTAVYKDGKGLYTGPVHIDHYGRRVPKPAHGSTKLNNPTNLSSQIIAAAVGLFDQISNKSLTIRRITIASIRVVKDEGIYQMDLFTDTKKLDKEKLLQQTMLDIKLKYGKNAVLKGTSYMEGATMRERNEQIGGHKAK